MVRFAISAAAFATTAKSALVELAPNGLDHSKVTLMMHVTAIQHRKLNFAHSLITCYTSLGLSTSVRYLLWSSGVGIWRDSTINRQHVYSFNYLTSRNAMLCAQLRTNVQLSLQRTPRHSLIMLLRVPNAVIFNSQKSHLHGTAVQRRISQQTHYYNMSPIRGERIPQQVNEWIGENRLFSYVVYSWRMCRLLWISLNLIVHV